MLSVNVCAIITLLMTTQSPVKFLKEVRIELGKVVWPGRKEATRLTAIVIGVSVFVGAFISALDFVFTKIMTLVVR